uniref:Angiotensin-converting enzyme n=2 Tax=Photinus pyralis TaxID=7054 RepID=A0A1Y1NAN0_PHOPY
MALRKVAYAPFAYLVDKWRYKVFRDGVSGMNSAWWNLRLRYQGVIPPEPRTDQHLDPAAKKHIPADIPYMNYYVALLLEFQIFEALCIAKGHTGQLHTCDLYRSREAGRILSEAMQVGKARHWKDVIRMITKGKSDSFSVKAILKYFQPLQQWLHVQNANEEIIGWNTNEEDTMLFQPLHSRSTVIKQSLFLTMIGAALLF